jgi:hypothetical protein
MEYEMSDARSTSSSGRTKQVINVICGLLAAYLIHLSGISRGERGVTFEATLRSSVVCLVVVTCAWALLFAVIDIVTKGSKSPRGVPLRTAVAVLVLALIGMVAYMWFGWVPPLDGPVFYSVGFPLVFAFIMVLIMVMPKVMKTTFVRSA